MSMYGPYTQEIVRQHHASIRRSARAGSASGRTAGAGRRGLGALSKLFGTPRAAREIHDDGSRECHTTSPAGRSDHGVAAA
jgi:hypothetical protein